ncbi:MAG: DUF4384 domain-containing protein [bacterium]
MISSPIIQRSTFLFLLLTTLLLLPWNITVRAQEKENVSFEWGFGVISSSTAETKLTPVLKDTMLKSGDQIKMVVKLKRACFVYVIHESPDGELILRFPYDFNQFTTDYTLAKNYYIPKGRDWFKLDKDIGRETFYLLASAERLTDLEKMLQQYKAADASAKPALAKDIVTEIRNVRKRYKTFTTYAERPISIGGNVRGVERAPSASRPDVASIATEISANNFYGRTFTLDHK